MTISNLYYLSKEAKSSFLLFTVNFLIMKIRGKKIIISDNVKIIDYRNIITDEDFVKIGVDYNGLNSKRDITLLNVVGKLIFKGNFSIGNGCRFDIGKNAIVNIGKGGYMNSFCNIIIQHGLVIGDNCAISWNCQFLDEDFHKIEYENKIQTMSNSIEIGNHVWIGCNTYIYKGVKIPNGCVIAANSVVKSSFIEENVLIAGNPAKIIKRGVFWE